MDETELVFPTIHLNGTSREELERQCENAGQALRDALTALIQMAPNQRDYYTQGMEAWKAAVLRSVARRDCVERVLNEVQRIHEAIVEAADRRNAV